MVEFPDRPEPPPKPEGYVLPVDPKNKPVGAKPEPLEEKSIVDINRSIIDFGEFETKPTDIVMIKFGLRNKGNRWVAIDEKDIDTLDKTIEKHWFKFRIWNYGEETDIKKRSIVYSSEKRMNYTDYDIMNELKVRRLLLDWSLNGKNENLKLFYISGYMVDQSWEAFTRLNINIIRFIISKMNEVLEYGE